MTYVLDQQDPVAAPSSRTVRAGDTGYAGKRLLDLLLVTVSLPLLLPVMALLAALVALEGHRPLYCQTRVGRHRRAFRIYKSRTMVPDAEARLGKHLAASPAARREWDQFQKLSSDPRITRIGHFLRRTSLDELPQLVNVLLGDMSLVGPRPMLPDQAPIYPGTAYFAMRPGITGPWQVSERNSVGFADRARFDQQYLESQSLAGDLACLARTVPVVVRMSGR